MSSLHATFGPDYSFPPKTITVFFSVLNNQGFVVSESFFMNLWDTTPAYLVLEKLHDQGYTDVDCVGFVKSAADNGGKYHMADPVVLGKDMTLRASGFETEGRIVASPSKTVLQEYLQKEANAMMLN